MIYLVGKKRFNIPPVFHTLNHRTTYSPRALRPACGASVGPGPLAVAPARGSATNPRREWNGGVNGFNRIASQTSRECTDRNLPLLRTRLDERPGQVALRVHQRPLPLRLRHHELEPLHEHHDGQPGRALLGRHLLLVGGGRSAVRVVCRMLGGSINQLSTKRASSGGDSSAHALAEPAPS